MYSFRFLWLLAILICGQLTAQPVFDVRLRPVAIPNLTGVHSFACAKHGGKWIIIGGRKDGLHKRLPWESFAEGGMNTEITVIDPSAKQVRSASIKHLRVDLREQLASSNMQYFQKEDRLLLVGGYGYSTTKEEHVTWPTAVSVDLAGLLSDILRDTILESRFQVSENQLFAVTGGQLRSLGDTLMLVGGHRFDGKYNPLDGPSFTQAYTESILRFKWLPKLKSFEFLPPIKNAELLHRRDLNVVEQLDAQGQAYLMIFSGVFQKKQNYPYLSAVHISRDSVWEQPDFAQYLNHYHCATLPIFDQKTGSMHTYFFGGIAQYFSKRGMLVQDNEVPFVPTIACVSRDAAGHMREVELDYTMPALLGASSEFIFSNSVKTFGGTVLDAQALQGDTISVGFVLGGIESSDANVFWYDELTSEANARLFEVYLVRKTGKDFYQENPASTNGFQLHIYPNADTQAITMELSLKTEQPVIWNVQKEGLGLVTESIVRNYPKGRHQLHAKVGEKLEAGIYQVTLVVGNQKLEQRVIVTP
jgi:hypothetical protein